MFIPAGNLETMSDTPSHHKRRAATDYTSTNYCIAWAGAWWAVLLAVIVISFTTGSFADSPSNYLHLGVSLMVYVIQTLAVFGPRAKSPAAKLYQDNVLYYALGLMFALAMLPQNGLVATIRLVFSLVVLVVAVRYFRAARRLRAEQR